MIRTLRPTDIVAYLAFRNQARENVALELPGENPGSLSMGSFLSRSLSLDPRRESWIEIQDGKISGLVGVKGRLGTDFWDIDQLAAVPEDSESTYINLLRHLSRSACEEGVQKIFLRTMADALPAAAARQVGFQQYAIERLFRLPSAIHSLIECEESRLIRPRRRADHHAIFQLYCAAVPAPVRQIEGVTLQEWRWTEGWGLRPQSWKMNLPRLRRDFVLEDDGTIAGWLQVRPRTSCIVLMLRPEDAEKAEPMLQFGIEQIGRAGPIFVPVRQYQMFLEPCLQKLGFELVAEHALLVKTLAIRAQEPAIVPLRVHASR